ncbi:hypothetical protein SAMN06272774_2582 [Synechococcus sp. 7002]|uniref:hypothetical protein n=2 Tax=Cyanobacteriota TaxID=1117 RepID=UPI00016DC89F|nr:hypothetical protein [Picosynechococcus sp. PCC 7002]ACA99481.1 hypothetical protein SYNPCC7002_A1490 [Picosynechococcus sp. PCC 7002]SMQ83914.1 hypothetical protein SAMN06272774_2582 [Synechococcus sp. 7002]
MKNLSVKLLSGTATMTAVSLMAINPATADTVSGSVTFTSAGEAISAYAVEVDSPGSRFNSAEIGIGYRPLDVGQLFTVGNTLYGSLLNDGLGTTPNVPGVNGGNGVNGIGSLASFLTQNNLTLVGGAGAIQNIIAQLNSDANGGVNLDNIDWTLASGNTICAGDLVSLTPTENPVCFEVEAVAPLTVTDEGFVAANVELTGSFDPTVILSDALGYLEFIAQDVRNSSVVLANGLDNTDLGPLVDAILQYSISEVLLGGGSLEQVIATVYDNPNLTTDTKNAIFQALAESGYLNSLSTIDTDLDALLGPGGVATINPSTLGLLPVP